jgi:lipopolysaccharide transport system ATP-binding protein
MDQSGIDESTMSDVAIRVEGLSKQYRIGAAPEKYKMMRDVVAGALTAPLRALRSLGRSKADADEQSFWAVRDVSFEIKQGEVVGVIGRNGAGKSTLLKLLARITEPTLGEAEIHGRIGALLEVGTGFHQELTGRENVFLNGAILGMRREEIVRKFDEIVEFAEVSKFIDTPVKRYSSGMHLRLAFSVAAHLEPEILLVDEVLAVGDVAFQKKCVGKMEDVASQGRTVLFVSHNLAAVKELCQTSIVLSGGRLAFRGSVVEGLAHYGQSLALSDAAEETRRGTHWRKVQVNGQSDGFATTVNSDSDFFVEAQFHAAAAIANGAFFCIVNDAIGNQLIHQRIGLRDLSRDPLAPGTHLLRSCFPSLWLAPGVYTVYFKFIGQSVDGKQEVHHSERLLLDVAGSAEGISRSLLTPPLNWTLQRDLSI